MSQFLGEMDGEYVRRKCNQGTCHMIGVTKITEDEMFTCDILLLKNVQKRKIQGWNK
jgi:hypothetical protein